MIAAPSTGRRISEPLAVGALGVAGLVVIDPPDAGIPWCPSALILGVACPLCGLTRGVARFVRGDIASSVGFHPLAWAVLVVAVVAWLGWFGRRAGWWEWRSTAVEKWTLVALGVGLVTTWAVRAVLGTLPPV